MIYLIVEHEIRRDLINKKNKVLTIIGIAVAAAAGLGIFGYNFAEIKAGS